MHKASPIPSRIPIIVDIHSDGSIRPEWERWLRDVAESIGTHMVGEVELENQGASIAQTAIGTPRLTTGLYRVNYFTRITQAASTSSSLTIEFRWTTGGIAQTYTAAALTGNTTTTYGQASLVIEADDNTTIDYVITYASVGATPMRYSFRVALEQL